MRDRITLEVSSRSYHTSGPELLPVTAGREPLRGACFCDECREAGEPGVIRVDSRSGILDPQPVRRPPVVRHLAG